MLSESQKIRDEIKYYERERNDWAVNVKMYNAKEKIKELDNKIRELKDKLYDIEFQELVNEEKKHTVLEG
ncbi:hypothetical protein [Clostridium sp. D53t1_180928_C8]|uniref:hypothetical protein n=1 Tax=Clostridium sp. D53t1_180928_C8 TaxID=2787101 RepID=UPI0018AAA044|nr:hypothetical protein [Clostridium sp. D53t1_180928_C8]